MVSSTVASAFESQVGLDRPPAASSRLDLHSWLAITGATLVASGILTLVVIAYSRVP
jgi:hypothetical protein